MTYDPTVWKAGDVVLPELLTKMEQGIAQRSALTVKVGEMSDSGGSLGPVAVRSVSSGSDSVSSYYVLQESTENIVSAFLAGRPVIVESDGGKLPFSKIYTEISLLTDCTESLGVWEIVIVSSFYPYSVFYGKTGEYPTTKEPDSGGFDDDPIK